MYFLKCCFGLIKYTFKYITAFSGLVHDMLGTRAIKTFLYEVLEKLLV